MNAPTAKSAPIRRWLQNLALSVGTFFLCVLLFEILLRCLGYGNLEIYQPDAVLFWRLKPKQDCYTKIDHKPVHINSLGTRGPEFDLDKPPQTLRILSLGDSRTFGWGLSEAETYSGRLQQLLQQQFGSGRRVEVINAGVNAWSYPQMLAYFRITGLRFHPDIVILAGANLWTQFSENSSPQFVKRFMLRVQLKNLLRRFAIYHYVVEVKLKKFYEQHRAKFIPVDPRQDPFFKEQQQEDPDTLFRSAIGELCRLALTNHVKPLLLYLPILDEWGGTNAPAVLQVQREINRQLAVSLVDMTPEVKPLGKTLYLEADPVHLNAHGNEIVAQRLRASVNQLLTNEQASHH